MLGVHGEIDAGVAGVAGVGDCGVQGRKRSGATVVDRR